MSIQCSVHLLPDLVEPKELTGSTVVVIDVLRATTTITAALAAGTARVIPCLEVAEARAMAEQLPDAVLGGERGGQRIEGFSLGNSPAEYTPQSVGGRTLVITTTNGTRAMMRCREADRVLIGAFANLSAVCAELAKADSIHLLCAGTDGQVTQEDVLLAGAIVDRQIRESGGACVLNDAARLAAAFWRSRAGEGGPAEVAAVLAESRGGRNLIELGMDADVVWCSVIDRYHFVSRLDLSAWQIRKDRGDGPFQAHLGQ